MPINYSYKQLFHLSDQNLFAFTYKMIILLLIKTLIIEIDSDGIKWPVK